MTPSTGTTAELKLALVDHIAAILDDLEMTDANEGDLSDQAIVELHERNMAFAGFLVGSLGLVDASRDGVEYTVKLSLADPLAYVDANLT